MKLFLILIVILAFLSVNSVEAKEQSIPLLAVVETQNGTGGGSLAEMQLRLQSGTGEVFIGTTSFAQIDTQITTKQAKEITCSLIEAECEKYDFFYTIEATSSVIKGPSAGSATAILTIATLTNQKLPEDIVLTGTLLTGGVIGDIGSVHEKVKLAADYNKKRVLVPKGSLQKIEEKNKSDIGRICKRT